MVLFGAACAAEPARPELQIEPRCEVPFIAADGETWLRDLAHAHAVARLGPELSPGLEPSAPERWSRTHEETGLRIVVEGLREARGFRVRSAIYDLGLPELLPVDGWTARVHLQEDGGIQFEMDGQSGFSRSDYVGFGPLRKGCRGDLRFRVVGDRWQCQRGRRAAPETECRRLEAELVAELVAP